MISDLDRRRVVEVLEGRSQRVIAGCLRELSDAERDAIEVVSIDPYEPCRQAIRKELSGARIVADRFHLLRGANTALDSVRRERRRAAGRAAVPQRPARGIAIAGPGTCSARATGC